MKSQSNCHTLIGARKAPQPERIDAKAKFSSNEQQMPCVTERICARFANGALERFLSIEYTTRREVVEAIIRRGYRRALDENAELRRELRRAA